MSVVANVAINVDARGAAQKLQDFQRKSQAAGKAAEDLQKTTNAAATAATKVGREYQTAANGMRYFIDATGRARKENGQFVTTAEAAAAGLEKQSKAAGRAAGALRGLGAAVGKLAAAFSAIQAAKFVFVQTAELEKQTRSLEVLTGSATKAAQIIKELKDIGAVTPFTSTELIDSAKRLQAFGVETNKVVETTRRLADVSGATGAELQGLVTAYGQVQAKGRLQGEELLQFQERGVALQQVLREEYKLSGEEFQDALSKGRISAEAVEYAIQKLTDAGGKYANGAVAQSDTLAGRLSTLQDAVQNLAQRLGTILAPAMQSILGLAIDIANQINNVFETILLQRQLGANLAPAMRDRLFKQAGQEAEQIARLRGGGTIDPAVYTQLREERFRDLMRTYGYEQGILTPPTAAPPTAAATLPGLMEATGKGKGKGADKAAAEEARLQARLRGLQIETQGTLQLALIKGKIAEAEMAGNKELAIRLQGEQRNQQILLNLQSSLEGVTDEREKQALQVKALADLEAAGIDTATEMERLMQKRANSIQDVVSGFDMELLKLQANTDVKKQALQFLEIENQLKAQGIILTDADAEAIRRKIAEIQKLTKEQQAANDQAKFMEQQFAAIGSALGDQLMGVFDNLINKTKDWNDVLRDSLMSIGKILMMAGLNMLAGTDGKGVLSFLGFGSGFGKRAAGGPVTGRTPYLVGERGPELFVPGTGGSVVPTNDLRAAMGAAPGSSGGPVLNMSFETTNIGGVEYVSREQLEAAMAATRRQAANDGAKRGMNMTLDRIQQSPQTRSRLGMR